MTSNVTVCIPTIPPRALMLQQALGSIWLQTVQPDAVIIEVDHAHTGAAATKTRAVRKVTTEWVVVLDDDDVLLPDCIQRYLWRQAQTDADVVYGVPYRTDRMDWPRFCGCGCDEPFNADRLRVQTFVHNTALVRTKMLAEVGFGTPGDTHYDEWGASLALLDLGARFAKVEEPTFVWNIHTANTGGRAERW